MTDEQDFRDIVRFDWVYFGRFNRLHNPVDFTFGGDWCAEDVTLGCGRKTDTAWIPGWFSRMSIPRCDRCCDASGLPRGAGSPKNDDECRRILDMPTKAEPWPAPA